jgi:hypothetical protein
MAGALYPMALVAVLVSAAAAENGAGVLGTVALWGAGGGAGESASLPRRG